MTEKDNMGGLDTFDLGYAAAKKEFEAAKESSRKELEEQQALISSLDYERAGLEFALKELQNQVEIENPLWLADLIDSGDLEVLFMKTGNENLRLKFYRLRQDRVRPHERLYQIAELNSFKQELANKGTIVEAELRLKLEEKDKRIAELEATFKKEYAFHLEREEALEKKLAEYQIHFMHMHALWAACGNTPIDFETEELTKQLAAARQQGFEEGKQAGRDELQKELSEQKPVAYIYPARYGSRASLCKNNKPLDWDMGDADVAWYEHPLIPRPSAPVKGE